MNGRLTLKSLRWKRSRTTAGDMHANTIVGQYGIGLVRGKSAVILRTIVDGQWQDVTVARVDTLEAARKAAKQDFEARIRSALRTASDQGGERG